MGYSYGPGARCFPKIGAPAFEILEYRDRQINRFNIYRNRNLAQSALNLWYYLCEQWSEVDPAAAFGGVRGAIIKTLDPDDFPRPVTNMIMPGVQQDVISAVKRGWKPFIRPTRSNPKVKAAARRATDQLNFRLKMLNWDDKRHQLGVNFVVTGTGLLTTYRDRPYSDLVPMGAPDAKSCPSCGGKLFSDSIPNDLLETGMANGQPILHTDSLQALEHDEGQVDTDNIGLKYCPQCETPTELEPYTPNPEDINRGVDLFGRPLGVLAPRGESALEVDLPHEIFPQDAGAHVTPDQMVRYGRRKIRSIEWIAERAPHLADQLTPDSAAELLYDDPLLGQWGILGSYSAAYDVGMLDNHKLVDELVELPSFMNPHGRYAVCLKNDVVEDGPLLESAQVMDEDGNLIEAWVPRINLSAARFIIRPNEFYGMGLPQLGISPQNRLNGIDSGLIEGRLRMGPYISMTPGMWVTGPVIEKGGFGKIVIFQSDPEHPEITKPDFFTSPTLPDSTYMERDRTIEDLKYLLQSSGVLRGEPVKNIGTTSGLQMMADQDESSRSLRQDDLARCAERAWSHILDMEWILRVDEEVQRKLSHDDHWEYESFRGEAYMGQTEVEIEKAPVVSNSILKRESAREALVDGVLKIDSPLARKRMIDTYGLESDINEDTNNQIERAEQQWAEFAQSGKVRVLDSIDDPSLKYAVFGTYLESEEGQELTKQAGWDGIMRAIAGWELELWNLIQLENNYIGFYGARLVGEDADTAYAEAMIAYKKDEQYYEVQKKINEEIAKTAAQSAVPGAAAAAIPVPPDPPHKPPPPLNIPVLLQDRIEFVWTKMLVDRKLAEVGQGGLKLSPQVLGQDGLDPALAIEATEHSPVAYLKFRALVEACKITVTGVPPPPSAGPTGMELPAPGTKEASAAGAEPASAQPPSSGGGAVGGSPPQPPAPPTMTATADGGAN